MGWPRRTSPRRLDFYRLCDCERILQFDAEVAHGAVHLCVVKQELNRSKIAGLPINLRNLRATHAMGAVGARLETDGGHPIPDETSILARRNVQPFVDRPGQRCSDPTMSGDSSQTSIAFRVPSVISKLTDLPVLP